MAVAHQSLCRPRTRASGFVRCTSTFCALASAIVGAGSAVAQNPFDPVQANGISFQAVEARFVRFYIHDAQQGQPCLDEFEVYGPADTNNLARVAGAKASASSLLPGYPIHQVAHLNDGRYGNSFSWIAAGTRREWAQIELPRPTLVDRIVVSRDRDGRFRDRIPSRYEVRVSTDGTSWKTLVTHSDIPLLPEGQASEEDLLRYAFACEDLTWRKVDPTDSVARVLGQMRTMLDRLATSGLDVSRERVELLELDRRAQARSAAQTSTADRAQLYFDARLAKRRLFLRAPDLAALQRVLFVKRHPYEPSHNYSVIFDAQGGPGGGVCVLDVPRTEGRLEPARARLTTLFDARQGIARDPVTDFEARRIYFGYRTTKSDYFHLWQMNIDGSEPRSLTDGPFHDYFPCPLPDGGLAFISTRCKARFICWRPQAFVLFRLDLSTGDAQPLSLANLSEWTPSLMRDGRILWMRSEYLDKGADFGHTLWAIRPDGTHPELIFGNNTPNCYAGGREVPGTSEILCTLVSHGGDLNGPIALVDPRQGRFHPPAVTSITPDSPPHYNMNWARTKCFRDPFPISRDYFLCSHAAVDRFGLYLLDRWGNREILYLDPEIGSMSPTLLRPTSPPPALSETIPAEDRETATGQFVVADVYRGLEPAVARGRVRYLRVCQELRADLARLPNGEYQQDHEPFQDWYATPIHLVNGPHGWPSYVAKADLGLAPVEPDGSANFVAPAGKILYFQALDENLNELQRMRSVVQLQPGEKRGCIGCHDNRMTASSPVAGVPLALRRAPSPLTPPPWGAGPFSYEAMVQPVWDAKCVRCHDANDKDRINLAATLDQHRVPASYRTLIERGWVHYFDYVYQKRHSKAEPLKFGTLQSRLVQLLEAGHKDVVLTADELRRVKTWIDLNCPLWPDYQFRPNRPAVQTAAHQPN